MTETSDGNQQSAFSHWLRTGKVPRALAPEGVELKFNPWHDPADGRFTFAGSGRNYGGGGANRAPKIGHRSRPQPVKQPNPVTEFVGGVGEGLRDVAKGTAEGIYSAVTTNPVTTVRNAGRGVAKMIDAAIAAEDTPARVQVSRAKEAVANASARDIGRVTGSVAGNVALTVAPGAALSKVSAARALRNAKPPVSHEPLQIGWVKENLGEDSLAKRYNDAATGAQPGQAPTLMRTMPDGSKRPVKFDGVQGEYVIDRKWGVRDAERARAQILRQSEALAQNHPIGIWEVPTEAKKQKLSDYSRK